MSQQRAPEPSTLFKKVSMAVGDVGKFAAHYVPLGAKVVRAWRDEPRLIQKALESLWQHEKKILKETIQLSEKKPAQKIRSSKPLDRRFKHAAWMTNRLGYFLHQTHLNLEQEVEQLLQQTSGLSETCKQQASHVFKEVLTTVSPDHFLWSNPEIWALTYATRGDNLKKGFQALKKDLYRWHGYFNVIKSNETAYRLGQELAVTPGQVVLRNPLMELIHYRPQCSKVFAEPVLITPSFINKYYILDLGDQNSLIQWLIEQQFDVYLISWANPTKSHAHCGFLEYAQLGPLAALQFIEESRSKTQVHLVGHCVGGIINSVAMSQLITKGKKDLAVSQSLLTTRLNFARPNKLAVLLTPPDGVDHTEKICAAMQKDGYWDGRKMSAFFNLLNSQEFFWFYFVSRYMRGQPVQPNPMLYWLQDVVHIPAEAFSFYLRMARDNTLIKYAPYSFGGVPLDFNQHHWPTFAFGIQQDQLDLWQSVYESAQLFPGQIEFVLNLGDHIGGMVCPAHRMKRGFWRNTAGAVQDLSSEEWLKSASFTKGSWWPHFTEWLAGHSTGLIDSTETQYKQQACLAEAPGEYVHMRV